MSLEYIVDRVVNLDNDGKVTRFIKVKAESTVRKPVDGIREGSSWYEKDTGKLYIFNAKQKKWIVPDDNPGSGGSDGGGSSGSNDLFIVHASAEDDNFVLDKTWAEINDAAEANKIVLLHDIYVDASEKSILFGFLESIDMAITTDKQEVYRLRFKVSMVDEAWETYVFQCNAKNEYGVFHVDD